MSAALPHLYLARHGETEWSKSGQHTGRTDLPLTPTGERQAALLGLRLQGLPITRVLSSPLQRSRHTAELAGFADRVEVDADLAEWNYGDYEGLTTKEIRLQQPDWTVFRDGCPQGESVEQIQERANCVLTRIRANAGDVLVFGHGHFNRVLAACWIGLGVGGAALLALDTATLCILGYDHDLDEPVIRLWNDDRHLEG